RAFSRAHRYAIPPRPNADGGRDHGRGGGARGGSFGEREAGRGVGLRRGGFESDPARGAREGPAGLAPAHQRNAGGSGLGQGGDGLRIPGVRNHIRAARQRTFGNRRPKGGRSWLGYARTPSALGASTDSLCRGGQARASRSSLPPPSSSASPDARDTAEWSLPAPPISPAARRSGPSSI